MYERTLVLIKLFIYLSITVFTLTINDTILPCSNLLSITVVHISKKGMGLVQIAAKIYRVTFVNSLE